MEERIIKDINNLFSQLFQKMKEAGYEWDDGEKELKKSQRMVSAEAKEALHDKPAWSEEDEENLRHCTGAIWAADYYLYEDKQKMEAWLKSIKDRYTWKPTNEQMDALITAEEIIRVQNLPDAAYELASLYEQLKKLM